MGKSSPGAVGSRQPAADCAWVLKDMDGGCDIIPIRWTVMANGFPLREEVDRLQAVPLALMPSTNQEWTSVISSVCALTSLASDTAGAVLPTDQHWRSR